MLILDILKFKVITYSCPSVQEKKINGQQKGNFKFRYRGWKIFSLHCSYTRLHTLLYMWNIQFTIPVVRSNSCSTFSQLSSWPQDLSYRDPAKKVVTEVKPHRYGVQDDPLLSQLLMTLDPLAIDCVSVTCTITFCRPTRSYLQQYYLAQGSVMFLFGQVDIFHLTT